MPLSTMPLSTSAFSVDVSESDGRAVVLLKGNADTLVLARFSHYMRSLHAEVSDQHVPEVHVDTGKLFFMTSSCLKVLVAWLRSITELGPEKRYKVVFLSNPDLSWQRRSFDALRHIADGLVTVRPMSSSLEKLP
jgi:hypothetical protein